MVPDPEITKVAMEAERNAINGNSGIDNRLTIMNGDVKPMRGEDGSTNEESEDIRVAPPHYASMPSRHRVVEKCVFVISTVTLVVMSSSLLSLHWLLPYYYAVSTPLLILLRVGLYWRCKRQYFLLDFCYFGNALCYIYIWAVPWQREVFTVLFAVANGPIAWATCMFRNSLVLHSVDKMTSVYIHVLPAFLTFSIRWYPESTSRYWYTSFTSSVDESLTYMAVWLFAVSLITFVLHSMIYVLVVYVLLRPSNDYINSYRYLSARAGDDSILGRLVNILGQKLRFVMYILMNWSYCSLSLVAVVICYKWFVAHVVYLAILVLNVTWNGAGFYMDVFAVKGFRVVDDSM